VPCVPVGGVQTEVALRARQCRGEEAAGYERRYSVAACPVAVLLAWEGGWGAGGRQTFSRLEVTAGRRPRKGGRSQFIIRKCGCSTSQGVVDAGQAVPGHAAIVREEHEQRVLPIADRCMFMLHVHVACSCCMFMLQGAREAAGSRTVEGERASRRAGGRAGGCERAGGRAQEWVSGREGGTAAAGSNSGDPSPAYLPHCACLEGAGQPPRP
jgi:hypothetical protein